jgi:hypothetical protein
MVEIVNNTIDKNVLFDMLKERLINVYTLIKRTEDQLNKEVSEQKKFYLSKTYATYIGIFNDSCSELMKLKGWNYADKDERDKQIRDITHLIQEDIQGKENK